MERLPATLQGNLERPRSGKRGVKFTPEEDELLLGFVEQMKMIGCLPQSRGIYHKLVENKDGKWPWSQWRTAKGWSRRYQRLLKKARLQAGGTRLSVQTRTIHHYARNENQSDDSKDGLLCQRQNTRSSSDMPGTNPDIDLEEEREVEEILVCHPRWRHKATFFSCQGMDYGDDNNEEEEEVTEQLCPLSQGAIKD